MYKYARNVLSYFLLVDYAQEYKKSISLKR